MERIDEKQMSFDFNDNEVQEITDRWLEMYKGNIKYSYDNEFSSGEEYTARVYKNGTKYSYESGITRIIFDIKSKKLRKVTISSEGRSPDFDRHMEHIGFGANFKSRIRTLAKSSDEYNIVLQF